MARVTPSEYAEKWSRRMKGSTEDIRRGVEKVTEAPGAAAARQAQLMLAKLTESITSGRWAQAVGAIGVQEWKDSITRKGLQRIAAGVDNATPQQAEMASKLLASVDAAVAKVNQTPRGDLETNIGRMATFAREMAKSKGKK